MSKETFLVRDFVKSNVRWNLCYTIDLCWSIISWQELLLRDYRNKVEEEEKDVEKPADEDDVAAVRSTLIMRTWRILTLRFQIFFVSIFNYLFFRYLKMLIHTLQYITRTEKKKNSNWHKWWRENVSGNQRRLGFRVVYCHVQLSGIDIYIKLQERTEEKRLQSLTFLCKNNRKWKVINWNYY